MNLSARVTFVAGLILTSLACNQRNIDSVCEEWLAKSGKHQSKTAAEVKRDADEALEALASTLEPRSWTGDWKSIGIKTVTLETRWRDGNLLYKFSITPPTSQNINQALSRLYHQGAKGPGFNLVLVDKDGFQTVPFFVALWDMSVGETSRTALGSVPCSANTYLITESWTGHTEGI